MRKETRHLLAWSKSFNCMSVLDHKNAETLALTLKEQIHGHQQQQQHPLVTTLKLQAKPTHTRGQN
jgi:hypothetical protein